MVTVSFHIPTSLLLTVVWSYALLIVLLNKLHVNKAMIINKMCVIMVLYSGQLIEVCECQCVMCTG